MADSTYPGPRRDRRGRSLSLEQQRSARYANFVTCLKEIVRLEQRPIDDSPPIDAMLFIGLGAHDPPGKRVCRAVDGLHPRLLELHCPSGDYCRPQRFSILSTKFPLERLVISGTTGKDVSIDSNMLARIATLHLRDSHNLDFSDCPSRVALRELILGESDGMDLICRLEQETNMLDNLDRLELTSARGDDLRHANGFRPIDFLWALGRISGLRILDLCLDHDYIWYNDELARMPSYLPDSLECFVFRGPWMGLADSAPWITSVQDREWMPLLMEFSFRLDYGPELGNRIEELSSEERECRGNSAREIRAAMAEFRPEVRIREEEE
ncbi:hypothetical protein CALCODRAFT_491350 [Calocera cornea HHB12733]|uniref:F-box domain-containing protein n=1 Tax=Calocera cornea HHB12733 TaxID=1353952 RepID=A0A165J1U3_9BASI|nr:hypothetical protein CALCODRAFT_491350 [Calocera cornea HHB12733]